MLRRGNAPVTDTNDAATAAAVWYDLEIIAPDAGSLQARAFAAVGLELVAFDFAFATC